MPAADSPAADSARIVVRQGLPARTAALLLSGQVGGDVAVSLLAVPVAVGPDRGRLAVIVDVDAATLLGGAPSSQELRLDVALYAITSAGAVAASLGGDVVLARPQVAEALTRGGIKLLGSLDVPPGPMTVRVWVQRRESAAFGLMETVVDVPAASEPSPARLVIDEPDTAWLVAMTDSPLEWDALAPAPAQLPATRPVLRAGTEVHARLLGRGWAAGPEARVVRDDGREVGRVPLRVESEEEAGGLEVRRVALTMPTLPAGAYTLELATTQTATPPAAPALPILVADGEPATSWPKSSAAIARVGRPSRPRVEAAPAVVPPEGLRYAYLDALARVTPADPGAAEQAVAEMERGALRDGRPDSARRLLAAEVYVAREIVSREGAALTALLQLHIRLAGVYGEERAAQGQAHAFALIDELTALATRPAGKPNRARAADAMACLAGSAQRFGAAAAAEGQYRIALLLDPDNAAALEGLAAGLEWTGQYPEAEKLLERLVALRSEAFEPKLRLALTRKRMGQDRDVEALLRTCIDGAGEGWIRAVAWQELAGRRIESGDWPAASRLLGEATKALPNDRELAVLQAFVLDRSGHRAQARAVAARLASQSAQAPSARFTYSHLPVAEIERSCTALASDVAATGAAALQHAVAGMPHPGGGA